MSETVEGHEVELSFLEMILEGLIQLTPILIVSSGGGENHLWVWEVLQKHFLFKLIFSLLLQEVNDCI